MKAFAGRRVLLVVENNSVPFDRRVWREALALKDHGAAVSVIAPSGSLEDRLCETVEGIRIYRFRPRFSSGSKLGYVAEYLVAFTKTFYLFHRLLWEWGRPHVIHVANPPDIFWPLALYTKFFRTIFIFDEHDLTPETLLSHYGLTRAHGSIFYWLLRGFQLLSYAFADAVISTNESYKRTAIERYPRNMGKLFIIRNGPDTRHFKEFPPNDLLRKGKTYLFAYIGIMAFQDGVEYIIRAIDYLVKQREFDDFITYLIGSGSDLARLMKLTKELGLEEKIIFTGRIPDEPALKILSTADICLSPDPSNPLNDSSTMNKIMEYMALGKPIVSFQLREAIFSAREAAIYVANNDAQSFGEGILKLVKDRDKRFMMGRFGKKRIEAELSWQRQIPCLIKAYDHALRKIPLKETHDGIR